jgi:hypothetical protein
MSIEANYVPWAIAIGVGATLVMDAWNLFLRTPPSNERYNTLIVQLSSHLDHRAPKPGAIEQALR